MGLSATRALLAASGLCAVAAIAAVVDPGLWPAVIGLDLLVAGAAVLDLLLSWPALRRLRVQIEAPRIWSRDRPETLRAVIEAPGRLAVALTVVPDLPRALVADPASQDVRIPGRRRAELTFRVTGTRRGTVVLHGLHLGLASRLGLWRLTRRTGPDLTVAVHPDLRQINDYALLARADRLDLIGVRRARRTGGDTEFERLRDHHSDDPLNRIDWKATARRDRLTVRDYQTSQCQALTLLVDAGRLMAARVVGSAGGTRALLDHAIDAALLLGYVALAQRDRVGLIAYADGIRRRMPTGGGPRRFHQLVHALHDLEAEPVLSRHDEALATLARTERKRSLVVILTQVLDDVSAELLERHAASLAGRHLPLIVLIRDDDLHAAVPPASVALTPDQDAFWLAGAAASVLNARAALIERLRAKGCLVLDIVPADLTPALISRYLEIKAANLL